MRKKIIQFGIIRSGSTLIYNILKEILPTRLIIKTHNFPSKWQCVQRLPIVCTYRDPLDVICSSIKINQESPTREVIEKHIHILKNYGYEDFLKLENKYNNKINLKYENFYNDYNYIFNKLENFLQINISQESKTFIIEKFSVKNIKKYISKFKNFDQYDENSQFHGLHISDNNGKIKSYLNFFNEKDIDFLKCKYKYFREKYLYD